MSALAFEDVSKAFGGVKALRGVSLSVAPGDAHALMGENGAGKSTLMKIAAGIHRPDSGRLLRNGTAIDLADPRAALAAGIGLVHQETLLFPNLDVAENIFAGHEVRRGWFVDRRAMHAARRRTARAPAPARRPVDHRRRTSAPRSSSCSRWRGRWRSSARC